MDTNKPPSSKLDRKTVEKNRRNHMKSLYAELFSLVSQDSSSSRENLALPDQIDKAINYVKTLQENVENLKKRRESLLNARECHRNISTTPEVLESSSVQVEVHEKERDLEVIIITDLKGHFVFTEAIRILQEEHAEVVNASYSFVESTIFHTIHAKIMEVAPSRAVESIVERLRMLSF